MNKLIRHFFTPNTHNNYRVKALHTDVLLTYIFICLVVAIIFSIGSGVLGIATDISINRLLEITNQKRAEHGLGALSYDERLADAARRKASDMISKNYWAHFGPNNESPWGFIIASGYRYETAGENLAKDFCCSPDVVDAWMASPTHAENILKSSYKNIGFAVVNGNLSGQETTLVVQMFGSPSNAGEQVARSIIPQAEAQEIKKIETPKEVTIPTKTQATIAPTIPDPSPTNVVLSPTPHTSGIEIVAGNQPLTPRLAYVWTKDQASNISFIAIIALALALICDLYYAYRLDLVRLSGKHLAHLVFVAVSLIGFMVITKGSIL